MTTQEKKTLAEVRAVLHMAEARIRGLSDEPDDIFSAACIILNSLTAPVKAHRKANHDAHKL